MCVHIFTATINIYIYIYIYNVRRQNIILKRLAAYNKAQSLFILPPGCSVDNVYFNSSNKLKLRPQRTGSQIGRAHV
jgi:hypothetical protein